MKDHRPDCTGWEDCDCFYVSIERERYNKLLEVANIARAAMNLRKHGDPENFGRGLTRAYDALQDALDDLDGVIH